VENVDDAIGQSVLGTVLVARSRDGVCAILIGSGSKELKDDLAIQFNKSRLTHDDQKRPQPMPAVDGINAKIDGCGGGGNHSNGFYRPT
jgi:hypothetical protein